MAEHAHDERLPIVPLGDADLVGGHLVEGGNVLGVAQDAIEFGADVVGLGFQRRHPGKGVAINERRGGDA